MRNKKPRKSSKRHRDLSLGEESDTVGPDTQQQSRKRRQSNTASTLSDLGTNHNTNERPSPTGNLPQNLHLTPAQTPTPTVVKQEEQVSDRDNHPFLPMLPFRSISRSSPKPRYSSEDEEAELKVSSLHLHLRLDPLSSRKSLTVILAANKTA